MDARAGPIIRASVLKPLVALLDRLPGGSAPLLRRHGLHLASLQDPYRLVPLRAYVALFEDAAVAAGDPALGLVLGQGIRPELLGPVGMVFNAAPTLQQAFGSLDRFLAAWQGGTRILLASEEEGAAACYRIEDPGVWPRRQDAEFSAAVTVGMVRVRLGPRWRPLEVRFEHAPPADQAPHDRLFGCPVRFGQPVNAILVGWTDLRRALPSPDPIVATVMENHLHDLLRGMDRDEAVPGRVAFIIASRLGQVPVTVPTVARELGLSSRSLQRQLRDAGTSLRDIVRTERLRTARMLLGSGRLSVEVIARSLGYADASILSRAFRQWEGVPPRRRGRGEAGRLGSGTGG